MTKVTINPTDHVTADARQSYTVKDSLGREFTLVKPNALAYFRLVKMLGQAGGNSAYMSLVSPLTYLSAIDGENVPFPATERELDALIQQLDDPGIEALLKGVVDHWGKKSDDTEAQEKALKNS